MIGYLLSRPRIRNWIIKRAMQTPDDPILAADGSGEIYMARYWLFNPLTKKDNGEWVRKYNWIPFSIRVHNIRLPDDDRHLHDHPFNARTWIMVGGYDELRAEDADIFLRDQSLHMDRMVDIRDYYDNFAYVGVQYERKAGQGTVLTHERYHKITRIHEHSDPVGPGAWTFFCFGDYIGPWGFLVNEAKVLHKEYIEKFKGQRVAAMEPDHSHCDVVPKGYGSYCNKCGLGYTNADGTIVCGQPREKQVIR